MHDDLSLSEIKKEYHGTYKGYLIGFSLSLIFTLLSFSLVVYEALPKQILHYLLPALAFSQAMIQLVFFL
ncbi:MAG: cytochrome o ubiquinol oxidase subunit IV, partial [Parachlamydiaceae bacterium]